MLNSRTDYTLFLDESGKTSFSDDTGEERFLLCGMILNKTLHEALSHYMITLKEKSGIPADSNIHAFDLFEKEEIYNGRITTEKVDEFFNRFTHLIEGTEYKTLIVEVDKTIYKERIMRKARRYNVSCKPVLKHLKKAHINDFLYECLAKKMILEFSNFLEKNDACGDVVAESRRWADSSVLKGFNDSTDSKKFRENSQYERWSKSGFARIIGITFENKKGLSFGLEASDFFAWSYFNTNYFYRTQNSAAKNRRVESRFTRGINLLEAAYLNTKMPELLTPTKLKNIAADRVSLFSEELSKFSIDP